MFQMSVVKVFLLLVLAASLGVFWYLDTKYYHWDNILPEPDSLIVENVPEQIVNDTFKPKVFVPTKEWQMIEKDQPIPPGLHVKIDLQTGEKKAKLMDDSETDKASSLAITHSNMSENNIQSKTLPEKVHKFKSYDEIKDDLNLSNMTAKSEIEIMDELSTKFQNQIKIYEEADQSLKNILTDLEYLLHQVDTAESFVKNNGINTIIIPCINSSSSFMKSQGALLLGAAASNNQKVQISALKADVISLLLKHISDDYEFKVQKNCFYALSSIIRQFPAAQKQVIDKNGIQIFMSVLKRPETDFNTKLKLKVSNLLQDLVVEIEDAKLTLNEETNDRRSSEAKEKVRQYEELHFKDKLVENGWCEILANAFIALSNLTPMNEESHDMVGASGKSLLAMSKLCKVKLQGNEQLYNSLYKLEKNYKELAKQDNNLNPLYRLMNELTNTYDPVLE